MSAAERESALRAVDFRGDATIETTDGAVVVGFVFDLREGPGEPVLRLLPADGGAKVEIPLSRIGRVELTGKILRLASACLLPS